MRQRKIFYTLVTLFFVALPLFSVQKKTIVVESKKKSNLNLASKNPESLEEEINFQDLWGEVKRILLLKISGSGDFEFEVFRLLEVRDEYNIKRVIYACYEFMKHPVIPDVHKRLYKAFCEMVYQCARELDKREIIRYWEDEVLTRLDMSSFDR